jgi:hypothetical protein
MFIPQTWLYFHVSEVYVTNKTDFGLDDWIYFTLYIHTIWDCRQYSAIAILHTFQFTAAHALGFPAFTSSILATDLSQSQCNFKLHMKSSLHRLIPFLQFLQLPVPRLHSTTLDYWCILRCTSSTTSLRLPCSFITPRHGPHGKHRVYSSID